MPYTNSTQTKKNIAWCLPRPKPDHYKGGMPLYCEDWLFDLSTDILWETDYLGPHKIYPDWLNLFCGMRKYGFGIDLNLEVNPSAVCDVHKLYECELLQQQILKHGKFDVVFADPPYSTKEAKELYNTPPLKYKIWTKEADNYLNIGGLFMVYHKYIMPNPNPEKYEVVKRVFIGTRILHTPRVCIIFKKKG